MHVYYLTLILVFPNLVYIPSIQSLFLPLLSLLAPQFIFEQGSVLQEQLFTGVSEALCGTRLGKGCSSSL
jgi:hypothetical protein